MHGHRGRKRIVAYVAIGIVILLALGVAGYFAKQYYDLRANPNMAAEDETNRLVSSVGKLYELPTDEKPVVGSVQDKEKLKDQAFFKNAQDGDKILIYQNNKLAIIYRQKDDKLINVGPITLDQAQQTTQTQNPTTAPKKP